MLKKPSLAWYKFFLGWPLSLLALFFIVKFFLPNIHVIQSTTKTINGMFLFYGIFCFFLYYAIRSYLWQKILNAIGHHIDLRDVCFLWAFTEIKRFIPGNIWSFLDRAAKFSDKGLSKKTVIHAMIIETQLFLFACVLLSLPALPIFFNTFFPTHHTTNLTITILFLFVLLGCALYLGNTFLRKYIFKNLHKSIEYLMPGIHPLQLFLFLCIAMLYLFFFGLGTYFVFLSVAFLSPQLLIPFVSFFVLSLLVGYLSILTPMGIGVREATVTVGLSQFIVGSLSAYGALLARCVLIFSEILFLAATYVWTTQKSIKVLRFERFIEDHKQECILLFFLFVYIVYFTTVSFLRYDNFFTGRFDLGNMDQTVWNTFRGRVFQLTDPNGTAIISRLAFHADFVLILLAPLYWLWSDPRMLLFVQTLVLAIGAFYVYGLSKIFLKEKNISLTLSILYLLNPGVNHTNLYDFHAVTLGTTFLLAMFYYYFKKKYVLFFLFMLLAAFTKEQVWVILSGCGLLVFFYNVFFVYKQKFSTIQKVRMIALPFLFSFVTFSIFYFLVSRAIPQARGGDHFALSYYSDFGSSPSQIIENIIFSPLKTLQTIMQNERLSYIKQLLLPLGFLPLFSPHILLLSSPDLLINLLSNNAQLHQIYFQYSATITPFLFLSTILTIMMIKKWFPGASVFIIVYLLCTTLYSAYFFGPLPGAQNPNIDVFTKQVPDKAFVNNYLARIPKRLSIASTNNIGSHLSHRQLIYTIPNGIDKADVVTFLLNDPFAQPSLAAQKQIVQKLKNDPTYRLLIEKNDFVVFLKKR